VALAGVLAMRPDVIVMDEPTSNLDPIGSSELLHLLLKLNKESGITLIMATHDVDMVPLYANKICILSEGKLVVKGSPNKIFSDSDLIRKVNLRSPRISHLFEILKKEDNLPINEELPLTISQARKQILDLLGSKTE
jgi:cobalt/nickel transport system ATP-binding protein